MFSGFNSRLATNFVHNRSLMMITESGSNEPLSFRYLWHTHLSPGSKPEYLQTLFIIRFNDD